MQLPVAKSSYRAALECSPFGSLFVPDLPALPPWKYTHWIMGLGLLGCSGSCREALVESEGCSYYLICLGACQADIPLLALAPIQLSPLSTAPFLSQALPQVHSSHIRLIPLFIGMGTIILREFILPTKLPLCYSLQPSQPLWVWGG